MRVANSEWSGRVANGEWKAGQCSRFPALPYSLLAIRYSLFAPTGESYG